jgi:serine/threonine-protein kinase HipA
MRDTLTVAAGDDRIPKTLMTDLSAVWSDGMIHGR